MPSSSVLTTCVAVRKAVLFSRNVEIGFVEGQWFNQVGVPFEDFAHFAGDRPIAREVRRREHGLRAKAIGANGGHSRGHALLSELVLAQHGFLECELVHCRIVCDLPIIPVIALQMPFERLDRRVSWERH